MTTARALIATIGFVGILTGPWWLPAISMILLSVRWRAPEIVLLGLLMDLAWQGSGTLTTSWHTWPLFTLLSITLLWSLEPIRQRFLF